MTMTIGPLWCSIGTAIRGASVIGFFLCFLSVLSSLYICLSHIFSNIPISISQPFEELQGWHSEYKVFTPKSITGWNHFGTIGAILNLSKVHISAI